MITLYFKFIYWLKHKLGNDRQWKTHQWIKVDDDEIECTTCKRRWVYAGVGRILEWKKCEPIKHHNWGDKQ